MTSKSIDIGPSGTAADGSPYGFRKVATVYGGDRWGPSDVGEHMYYAVYDEWLSIPFNRWLNPLVMTSSATFIGHPTTGYAEFPFNQAGSSLYAKLTQSDFNAGVFAGEFRETIRFISDSIRRLAQGVALATKGNLAAGAAALAGKRPGQSLGAVAGDNWLTFKYALMPLLSDISGAYKLLTSEYKTVSRVSGFSKKPLSLTSNRSNGLVWKHEHHCLVEYRCEVDMSVSNADRIGLTDPLSIAWELTRLSFVVDWFLPIGNFLSAINARRKLKLKNDFGWITKATREKWSSPKVYDDWLIYHPGMEAAYRQRVYVDRYQSASRFPVSMPTLQNPLGDSMDRFVSAMALLGQAVRR